jgi:bisphosphoglycerate-independent phosphoglycerate mutase (AlkP superfamily)
LHNREIARIAKCSHGSVHAEVVAFKKEKEATEKQKMQEFQESIKADSNTQSLEELKKMDLLPETIKKIEQTLEQEAKSKVSDVQGPYYETYD